MYIIIHTLYIYIYIYNIDGLAVLNHTNANMLTSLIPAT